MQDLLNGIKIGALGDGFKDKKIILIVSLQWFLEKEINKDGFKAHFSELQFYKTMNNEFVKTGLHREYGESEYEADERAKKIL